MPFPLDTRTHPVQPFAMHVCDYCGRENADDVANCSGCGNQIFEAPDSTEPKQKTKSKAVAVTLALIFGPLGLLYLGGEGLMAVLLVAGLSFFIVPMVMAASHQMNGLNLLINLLGRAISAWWAISVVDRRNADPEEEDARALLAEAVKLENVDFGQAIAKYEEVIARFPNTAAAVAAKDCVRSLRKTSATGGPTGRQARGGELTSDR